IDLNSFVPSTGLMQVDAALINLARTKPQPGVSGQLLRELWNGIQEYCGRPIDVDPGTAAKSLQDVSANPDVRRFAASSLLRCISDNPDHVRLGGDLVSTIRLLDAVFKADLYHFIKLDPNVGSHEKILALRDSVERLEAKLRDVTLG